MKYILIIGCFIYSMSVFAQYTAIPDPNFENYLEQNGMGDGVPNNGQVLTANINTVTELLVNSLNISDLTGIEDFV
ncbi:T9SS C-terminal target domain-containing protein, partial [Aequorivita sp. F47161]|nr:T9SS C-terminal target domain-containing protein [Aequorivita vitellina]